MYLMPSKHHLENYQKENKTKQNNPEMSLGLKYNSRQPSQGQVHHPAEAPQPGGFWESDPMGEGRSMTVPHMCPGAVKKKEGQDSGLRTPSPMSCGYQTSRKPSPRHLQVRLALPSFPSSWHCWHDHSKHSKMV